MDVQISYMFQWMFMIVRSGVKYFALTGAAAYTWAASHGTTGTKEESWGSEGVLKPSPRLSENTRKVMVSNTSTADLPQVQTGQNDLRLWSIDRSKGSRRWTSAMPSRFALNSHSEMMEACRLGSMKCLDVLSPEVRRI